MKQQITIDRENILLLLVEEYVKAYRCLYIDAIIRHSSTNEETTNLYDELFISELRKAWTKIIQSIKDKSSSTGIITIDIFKYFDIIDPISLPSPIKQRSDFEQKMLAISDNFFSLCKEAEEMREKCIRVPIADNHCFLFDDQSHINAFMLGGTGSGKSTLMHMFLDEAVKIYSPNELQFYLMDFKDGIELNRYAEYPHVRALMVEEGDSGIALEILRDIKKLQHQRNELLREAGCRSVQEYNDKHPDKHLPFIILLVDECQNLFDFASYAQQEINSIISNMTRKGRSQGIHFIFATQTISGTPIPSDVQKLITDWYLLNCDSSDAERTIEGSWKIIKELPKHCVVHYNKTDKEYEKFMLHKMENDNMNETLQYVKNLYSIKNYGFETFYFNGKQEYSITEILQKNVYRRHPEIALGRSFAISEKNPSILLKRDIGQNLLILGSDAELQGLRLLVNSIISLKRFSKSVKIEARFILFLNHDLEDYPDMEAYISDLEQYGIEIADNRSLRTNKLREIYEKINKVDKSDSMTFVFVSSQDTYVEMRQDVEIEIESILRDNADKQPDNERQKNEANIFFGGNLAFARSESLHTTKPQTKKTIKVKEAWRNILREGPEKGVHTIWQLQDINNLLFNDNKSYLPREIPQLFLHAVFLKAKDSKVAAMLQIDQYVKLEMLNDSPRCLRAVILNLTTNSLHTIVPFTLPTKKEIRQILK